MKKLLAVLVLMGIIIGAAVPILVHTDTASACDVHEGLTPGYWKNHLDAWQGYSPTDNFDEVFGLVGGVYDDYHVAPHATLLDVLNTGGGKWDALNRHAVAALLNASSSEVDYYYGVGMVKTIVKWAYQYNSWEHYKNVLENENEMGVVADD